MSPVYVPVTVCSLPACLVPGKFRLFGCGAGMPESVCRIMKANDEHNHSMLSRREKLNILIQGLCCVRLVAALAQHPASAGIVGLCVIIFATALCGISPEEEIGRAFTESMPFCALLCVFFGMVTIISAQHLFDPVISRVFAAPESCQMPLFYLASGIISPVPDNVFVATIYIELLRDSLLAGLLSAERFNELAIAVNAGTSLPSAATPNSQPAFLFLLTSPPAPMIRLSYFRMMWMALPCAVIMTLAGLLCMQVPVPDVTAWLEECGVLAQAVTAAAAQP